VDTPYERAILTRKQNLSHDSKMQRHLDYTGIWVHARMPGAMALNHWLLYDRSCHGSALPYEELKNLSTHVLDQETRVHERPTLSQQMMRGPWSSIS